ncbi:superinfection immunity protein [Azohydromonas australica]|uniref:superinfection immunity protein n=1 Tax=Azohydromonas australica TaxID=364039 RepID=UPI0005B793B2|nr:superinfection immunity protein [Azohydromonas australica]
MFAVRFLILLALTAFSWAMGTQNGPLNALGEFIAASFFIFGPALYMLPTYEAWKKQHPNLGAISLVNIFLGWSVLGWVVAVAWAFKRPEPSPVHVVEQSQPLQSAAPRRDIKKCPFCAEEILAEAKKCKHCKSDLQSAT